MLGRTQCYNPTIETMECNSCPFLNYVLSFTAIAIQDLWEVDESFLQGEEDESSLEVS
jgi:hypothetical protein